MSPADAVDALELGAFVVALLAAVRVRDFRPVPFALAVDLASELAQVHLADAYAGTGRPYTGLPRLAFHVAQAWHLAWPALALWLAWGAFARRPSAAPALALWSVAVAVAVVAYPWPSKDLPGPAYAAAQVVAVVAEAVAVGAWARRGGALSPLRGVGLAVVAGELATLLCPYLATSRSSAWDLVLPARASVWVAVGVVAWATWKARRGSPVYGRPVPA